MNNLEKLLKIQEIVNQKDLNEYIKVLIEIEKEYTNEVRIVFDNINVTNKN